MACKSNQVKKLEGSGGASLCRYTTRPVSAEERLSVASDGDAIVAFKTPYDDGTSSCCFAPIEFIGRIAAPVPKPRANWRGRPFKTSRCIFLAERVKSASFQFKLSSEINVAAMLNAAR